MITCKASLLHPMPEQAAIDHGSGQMPDRLTDFDWSSLLTRYDRRAPNGDRQKYYDLVEAFAGGLTPDAYAELLCWKLGARFGPYRARRFLAGPQEPLKSLAQHLPASLRRDVDKVMEALELIGRFPIEGMGDRHALPMRTTLLHFSYPEVVPIFDTMVLRAVLLRLRFASVVSVRRWGRTNNTKAEVVAREFGTSLLRKAERARSRL